MKRSMYVAILLVAFLLTTKGESATPSPPKLAKQIQLQNQPIWKDGKVEYIETISEPLFQARYDLDLDGKFDVEVANAVCTSTYKGIALACTCRFGESYYMVRYPEGSSEGSSYGAYLAWRANGMSAEEYEFENFTLDASERAICFTPVNASKGHSATNLESFLRYLQLHAAVAKFKAK